MGMNFQFAASSRKHRVTRAQIRHAVDNATQLDTITLPKGGEGWFMVGNDIDGVELEIAGLVLDDGLYIIHAMPTARRAK